MTATVDGSDVFGLLRPAVDAHTLGISAVAQLIEDCGLRVVAGDEEVNRAVGELERPGSMEVVARWIAEHGVTRLGLSYRLDPADGATAFGRLVYGLGRRRLLAAAGGPIVALYFAGLPEACRQVAAEHGDLVAVFCGDESPAETLACLGIPAGLRSQHLAEELAYDEARLAFGRDLLRRGKHLAVRPVDRGDCPGFGTAQDSLVARLQHGRERRLPPLMRAHVGPYLHDRAQAVQLFLEWARQLAGAGLLDVLSIGTSQLSQSAFGEEWDGRPDGGGVPLAMPEELRAAWQAARPMLVRTYAGTKDVPRLAWLFEDTLHNAWPALSLWWFCRLDGRGPYSVRENLEQHLATLRLCAGWGKPYEPNVSHHFSFRGADDVTYIVAAVLAARTAKACGIRHLVLQNMLNTPKGTWGVQDLAKSRALLALVRELEDDAFQVMLQPRAGLDYFSPDLERAKVQLAAVTALMDDIEPHDPTSPPVIHVVSYSEGSHLADPPVINESIQITRAALAEYRRLRARGEVADMSRHPEVAARTAELLLGARAILQAIAANIAEPYTAEGLYRALHAGFLPVPYLWACRDEFAAAVRWRTSLQRGSVRVVDEDGRAISARDRARATADLLHGATLTTPRAG